MDRNLNILAQPYLILSVFDIIGGWGGRVVGFLSRNQDGEESWKTAFRCLSRKSRLRRILTNRCEVRYRGVDKYL